MTPARRFAIRGRRTVLALATAGSISVAVISGPTAEAVPAATSDSGVTVVTDTTATPAPTPSTAPGSSATTTPWCDGHAPVAPWRLVATRSAADATMATIEWSSVACATRYNVSVFALGSDTVTVVPGSQTSYTLTGLNVDTTYQIQVSSRNDLGQGATGGTFFLRSATPSAIKEMKVQYGDVTGAVLRWAAPQGGISKSCVVKVKRVSDQKVMVDATIDCGAAEYPLTDLDSRQMYVVTVRGVNDAGEGPLARMVIGGDKPNPVKSISAIRDPGNPSQVIVSWLPSDNTGRGKVIGYEIGYGHSRADERIIAKSTDTSVAVPADKSVVVIVRVLTDAGKARWSKPVRIPMADSVKLSTTDDRIDLIEQEGVVTVAATSGLARSNRLVVSITPTANNGGFTDTQYSQNGAQALVFRTVPSGSYLVKVSGGDRELARKYINVGNLGLMGPADWEVVSGSPSIHDGVVEMTTGGETRVLSTRSLATQDVVLQTRADLNKGQGYGVWFRSSIDPSTKKISGLTVQYDPGWNNKFIIRQWNNGTECSNPIAAAPFPSGMKVYDAHNVVVAAQGDSLYVTIDGQKLFDVPSLAQAIANNSCHYPAPTGTRVGLRTWGSTAVVFTSTWVR